MRRGSVTFLSLALVLLTACFAAPAGAYVDEDRFFSYERFFLNTEVVDRISPGGLMRDELNRFAESFTDGIYAISAGDLEKAEKDLLKAREIWPEYYGPDFLLALVHESRGDYRTAARYYKSYLKKLKALHTGMYRISAPLILAFSSGNVEIYDGARELVEKRLARYGISLAGTRLPFQVPWSIFLLLLSAIALCGAYIVIRHRLMPHLRKQHLIKHPPEGFWVCRHCAAANPDPCTECQECGRARE